MATHHDHSTAGSDDAVMTELLDLDAEVLHAYLSEVTAWVHQLAGDPAPSHLLDLGSGTGTGTFALLERFEKAEVTALDMSAPYLRHLRNKAEERGVAHRVRTVQADLDAAWADLDPVDLVWAASSLHHMADPVRTLTDVRAALRPGGLLVAVELDSFPHFLPDDLGIGRPGLEARCRAVMAEERSARLPHMGADWGPLLTRAGFTVETERVFTVDLTPPLPASTGRYAQLALRRLRTGLGERLSADDQAALDVLLDDERPDGILRRGDLHVRTTRTAWAARRP
ncbi:class I SAM-dependent methyltransferase [Nonomuraea sp. NPDC050022]|uniref:class I SAM-dependent methyltransferase n=1 Tax=Nonomuraea sp. NPDC050022 TaxID=3364358 RepID=UPI0037912D91